MPAFATVSGSETLLAGDARPSANHPAIDRSQARLLVVDDDELTGLTIASWLEAKGYPVERADSPAAAAQCLAKQDFALILSDVNMPGNFRLEWIERQLQRPECPPILLFTGSPDLETACRVANLPVTGYLLKPVEFSAVDDLIQRVLRDRALRADLAALAEDVSQVFNAVGTCTEQEVRLVTQLKQLAATLPVQNSRPARNATPADAWREAIHDTIAVLEKTKHSFRSKDLGSLRQRLQKVLQG